MGEDDGTEAKHFFGMTHTELHNNRAVYIPGSHSAVVLGTITLTVSKIIEIPFSRVVRLYLHKKGKGCLLARCALTMVYCSLM